MVTIEPAVASARTLGLGLKVYPSNMQHMLNKDFTRFMKSLSRVRQNRVSERKALLAGRCDHNKLGKRVLVKNQVTVKHWQPKLSMSV